MDILSLDNLTGRILLISPKVTDMMHSCAVALVYAHSKEIGAKALLLTRPTIISFESLLNSDLESHHVDPTEPEVFIGGTFSPEQGTVVHTAEYMFPDSMPIDDKLYYSHAPVSVGLLNEEGDMFEHASFYLGHIAWKAGQLEQEILNDKWYLTAEKALDVLKMSPHDIYEGLWGNMGIEACSYFDLSHIHGSLDFEEDDDFGDGF